MTLSPIPIAMSAIILTAFAIIYCRFSFTSFSRRSASAWRFMPDVVALPNYFAFPVDLPSDPAAADRPVLGALSYSFIGSYVWTIQYLVRRISNFDLAPISFFQSVGHMLLAVFTMAAIWQSQVLVSLGPHALVIIAFLV